VTDRPNPPTNLIHPAQTRTTTQVKFAYSRSYEAPVKTELQQYIRAAEADPPWLFENRTGKVALEYPRLHRYCSPGPYLELFARSPRPGWTVWGDEAETYQTPDNPYSRQSEAAGWRLFEKPEADSPVVDSPTAP
jgi:hypothetical protein